MPYTGWKSVAVRDALYSKVEKQAEKEHRSVSNYVEKVLSEALGE